MAAAVVNDFFGSEGLSIRCSLSVRADAGEVEGKYLVKEPSA